MEMKKLGKGRLKKEKLVVMHGLSSKESLSL